MPFAAMSGSVRGGHVLCFSLPFMKTQTRPHAPACMQTDLTDATDQQKDAASPLYSRLRAPARKIQPALHTSANVSWFRLLKNCATPAGFCFLWALHENSVCCKNLKLPSTIYHPQSFSKGSNAPLPNGRGMQPLDDDCRPRNKQQDRSQNLPKSRPANTRVPAGSNAELHAPRSHAVTQTLVKRDGLVFLLRPGCCFTKVQGARAFALAPFVLLLFLCGAIQEGHNLRPRAVRVGTEVVIIRSRSDPLRKGPQHSLRIVGVGLNIRKGVVFDNNRRACRTVQEGHSLPAGYDLIRAEGRRTRAAGDPLLHSPQNRVIVVSAALHILKGVAAGLRRRSACSAARGRSPSGRGCSSRRG